MNKLLAICPFCDAEQRVEHGRDVVKCGSCGKAFNADHSGHSHPSEFWSNPDTCARF